MSDKKSGKKKVASCQEKILQGLLENKIRAGFFLVNGFKLSGQVVGHDKYCVVIKTKDSKSSQAVQQMIFKHAISTIIPEKWIDIK